VFFVFLGRERSPIQQPFTTEAHAYEPM